MDVGRHPNIELLAYSEVEKVEGTLGAFTVTIRKKARYVDESKCTGCGACAEKCPTRVSDPYNEGLAERKAIYRYFAQGIPSTYTIDPDACRHLAALKAEKEGGGEKGKVRKCGVCEKICQAKAINYFQQDQIIQREVDAIVLATGYEVMKPVELTEYGYGRVPNVITAIEFERLLSASGPTAGHLYRPADFVGRKKMPENLPHAKRLAFIQCVGSRHGRYAIYCSGFCCMHSIKEAIIAVEHDPEVEAWIFGMDIRAAGKGFEENRVNAERVGVRFIRSRVAEIVKGPNNLPVVWYEDTKERRVYSKEFDIVILASACYPPKDAAELAERFGVELDRFGFIKTRTFAPFDTTRDGIFVCGCAKGPADIPVSVAQASSAAARVAQMVLRENRKVVGH
ncbi:MAG: 4Fe-4S binding protein [Thermodesulforhabdaceae bacterium]|jgi:heterodisulfide reductase subunit A